jgi:hypothetical protein
VSAADVSAVAISATTAIPWRAGMSDLTMYYGVASGQQRSALSRLEPEGVMISHATANNKPLDGEHETFVDCGGYHHMMSGAGEYDVTDEEYLRYLLKHRPALYALWDYPCEPDLLDSLGRSVREQQERSLDAHARLLGKVEGHSLADSAVSVVQGWTVQQYLDHLDRMSERDVLTDYVAIGSVCRRGQDEQIANVVLAVRDALPDATQLHAFGVKGSVLRFREVVDALDSVDSAAYDYAESRLPSRRSDGESFTWRDSARAYLNWRHDLETSMATESLHDQRTTQTTLA